LWTNVTGSWVQTATNATAVVNNTQNTISYTLNSLETVKWNVKVSNSTYGTFASSNYTLIVTNRIAVSPSDDQWVTSGNSQQYLVRTSTGVLYCVYFKQLGGDWAVYVSDSADNGATWVNETLVSTSSSAGYPNYFPSITIDSNNNIHVVWEGTSSSYNIAQIWYSKYNGTAWSNPIVLSTYSGMNNGQQSSPTIAVDSNNHLHVVWYGLATGYSYAQIWDADYNGTAWSTPVRLSTVAGMNSSPILMFPCIVVDSNNNLDVLFRGNATGYANSEIWFTQYNGTWSTPIVVSTYSGMSSNDQISPGLAVDSNNNIYAGWDGKATGYSYNQIWIAKYNGTWQTPVRISTNAGMDSYDQGEPSIAVDAYNRVHVLWHGAATNYADNDKVWYANCTNGVWSTPQCLQPSSGLNTFPNVRWSSYPSFNIPNSRLDYVFTVGTASPYNVTFSYLGLPVAANASKLVLTAGAGQSVIAGQLSGPITVQRQDQYGNPVTSGSLTVTLNSTSPGATFYSDAGNTSATFVNIVNGSSTVSFWYTDTNAGSPTLTASAVGLTSATTSFTITSAPSPPTYSNISISSTFAGQPCSFSSHWSDTYGLSGYIFSTNNTGLWQNTTWTPFSGTSALASVTQNLNSNIGAVIAYVWYANNTNGLWNNTGIQTLTATDSALGLSPFSIISNSTVSEVAFNSTSEVLEFTVSGPSGTTGFTNVTIAKTLIGDISTLKVYLDGNETNYTVNDLTYSWLIHFTYHHSAHKIIMDLVSQQTGPPVAPPIEEVNATTGLVNVLPGGLIAVISTVSTSHGCFRCIIYYL